MDMNKARRRLSTPFEPEVRTRLEERCGYWQHVLVVALGAAPALELLEGLSRHAVSFRQPVPESLRSSLQAMGADAADALSRIVITRALLRTPGSELTVAIPEAIQGYWARERDRIVERVLNQDVGAANLCSDSWRKELLIASGSLLPIGAGFVDYRAGVPRSILLRGGMSQFLRGLRALASAGGRKPFLELHAHTESIGGFSPAGWQASYRVLAELLLLNPQLRGVTRSNWFIDPRMAEISPHLIYTREVPRRHGAVFLFVDHDRKGTSGALARSAMRRAMFERGEYVPEIHMMIWPRKQLIGSFGP